MSDSKYSLMVTKSYGAIRLLTSSLADKSFFFMEKKFGDYPNFNSFLIIESSIYSASCTIEFDKAKVSQSQDTLLDCEGAIILPPLLEQAKLDFYLMCLLTTGTSAFYYSSLFLTQSSRSARDATGLSELLKVNMQIDCCLVWSEER